MSIKLDKKPDQVVFNDSEQRYEASILSYPTNIGAPKIEAIDTVSWKNNNLQKTNAQLKARFASLKKSFDDFAEQYKNNELLYRINYNFEPLVGETYHLYLNKNKEHFLSIISPNECRFTYVGSFYLNEEMLWIKEK